MSRFIHSPIPPRERANWQRRRILQLGWRRYQSGSQILKAQLGFNGVKLTRPQACSGCRHYHGQAYGQIRSRRTRLICGFHPYGPLEEVSCPDWQEE